MAHLVNFMTPPLRSMIGELAFTAFLLGLAQHLPTKLADHVCPVQSSPAMNFCIVALFTSQTAEALSDTHTQSTAGEAMRRFHIDS